MDASFTKSVYPITISMLIGSVFKEILVFNRDYESDNIHYSLHLWTADKEFFNDTNVDYTLNSDGFATCVIDNIDEV